MSVKRFEVAGLGNVAVYKRRGSQSIRLSVTAAGEVRVVIPTWAPFTSGTAYAQKQQQWIAAHQPAPLKVISNGQQIGKDHQVLLLRSQTTQKVSRRISGTTIIIKHPADILATDPTVQTLAIKASVEALRSEAEAQLPGRLQKLASQHDFTYKNVSIKKLKSRWGSCDNNGQIVLNLYLMQLPWELIDYVLLHELTHTLYMSHGQEFWSKLSSVEPRARALKRQIRNYQTILQL